MRIVLDTHVLVFAAGGDLAPARKRLLEDATSELYLSAVTLWELTKLVELGHLVLPDGFEGSCAIYAAILGTPSPNTMPT